MSVDELEASIQTSGLLFQMHPDIGAWKATRAVSPEVSAWTNEDLDHWNRLSLERYLEGERDEDDYVYHRETWVVEEIGVVDREIWGENWFHSREDAVEYIREIMEEGL